MTHMMRQSVTRPPRAHTGQQTRRLIRAAERQEWRAEVGYWLARGGR